MGPSPQPPEESAPNKHLLLQQLEACFALFPDAIVVWDWTGKILFLNTAACTLFEVPTSDSWVGMSAQQFLQRYEWWDEQQRPFDVALWLLDQTTLKKETASCISDPQTLVLGLPSHRKMFLELRCSPVLGADRQPFGMLSVFHAVVPRYQEALHIQRVYKALVALNKAIALVPEQMHVADLDEPFLFSPLVTLVGQQLVDVMRQVLACWGVKLLALRAPNLHISYIVGSGFTTEQQQWYQERNERFLFTDFFDETVLARLRANQEVILSSGSLRIPAGYPAELGAAHILAIPVLWQHTLAGMFLIHKHEWEGGYTPEEIDLVRVVAAQALRLIECLSYLQTYVGEQARNLVLPEVEQLCKGFLTLASHELRTPLTGIKGNLQLAQRRLERLKRNLEQQPERISEHLEQTQQSLESAQQSVRLQERMVQDMIDDARIQTDQLDLSLQPWDLLALVKQTVAKQQASMPERAIELEILASETALPALVDVGRITQVLTIYLATALAYSPAERPVTVQVQAEGRMARVLVHDEGPGIPPEEQGHLWDRLYRGKGSAVQHELDLSLGLSFYLCRALIERHHGSVGVESEPGHGATFWLTLPIMNDGGDSSR